MRVSGSRNTEKIYAYAALSTTNTTWPDPGSKQNEFTSSPLFISRMVQSRTEMWIWS
jgi:hypothetical protein